MSIVRAIDFDQKTKSHLHFDYSGSLDISYQAVVGKLDITILLTLRKIYSQFWHKKLFALLILDICHLNSVLVCMKTAPEPVPVACQCSSSISSVKEVSNTYTNELCFFITVYRNLEITC